MPRAFPDDGGAEGLVWEALAEHIAGHRRTHALEAPVPASCRRLRD
jgi:hypothetical protein